MSTSKALVATLLAASAARADGSATTLFDSRPYTRDGGHLDNSLYEQFALSARADGADWLTDMRIVARGWGRLTIGTSFDEKTGAGDLDSLFFEGRILKRHLLLRVGRQLVTGGAVRATQFDGITADGVIMNGFGAQAWAGVPTQVRFSQASGDFLGGGRAFWRKAFDSEVGVSYVYALRKGYLARSDLAIDASYTPIRALTLSGLGQWSLEEGRLAEGRIQGLWQFDRKLQFVADIQRTAPDLFLDRSSIFAVFSEERRDEAGLEAVYRLIDPVSLEADAHLLSVEGGEGFRGGARGTYRTPTGNSYGTEVRFLYQPDNGYTLARIFGIRRLPRNITITLDLDAYFMQKEIRGSKSSFVATGTGGWAFLPNWDATLALALGSTPYFETRTEIIARVTYRFGIPAGLPGAFK